MKRALHLDTHYRVLSLQDPFLHRPKLECIESLLLTLCGGSAAWDRRTSRVRFEAWMCESFE